MRRKHGLDRRSRLARDLGLHAHANGCQRGLGVHLAQHVGAVDLHRPRADLERVGDLAIGEAGLEPLQHLRLALGQGLDLLPGIGRTEAQVDQLGQLLTGTFQQRLDVVAVERVGQIADQALQDDLRAPHRIEDLAVAQYGRPVISRPHILKDVGHRSPIVVHQDQRVGPTLVAKLLDAFERLDVEAASCKGLGVLCAAAEIGIYQGYGFVPLHPRITTCLCVVGEAETCSK
ncbi:hypothetical protein NOVOSPHI9U_70203 [Novosphingobium sp. 9U]|nr:hypothetical protein NOVOSPHI9U_70203 [Novosphingobium sp. 9U]